MNTRQRERVADLGRAFQSALEEIIEMGEGETRNYRESALEEIIEMEEGETRNYREEKYDEEACQEEVCQEECEQPTPLDVHSKIAQWDVNIKHVHNGFIVQVGCQTFVFEAFDKMAKYMAIYYNDPQGAYTKHYKGELLKEYL